jgi:hypothetical protein
VVEGSGLGLRSSGLARGFGSAALGGLAALRDALLALVRGAVLPSGLAALAAPCVALAAARAGQVDLEVALGRPREWRGGPPRAGRPT